MIKKKFFLNEVGWGGGLGGGGLTGLRMECCLEKKIEGLVVVVGPNDGVAACLQMKEGLDGMCVCVWGGGY